MRAPAARARQRGFFDFSITELAIIFGLALVVLGPKKLPPLVKQIGRWVGRARHMARQFREQLEQEVESINAVKPVPRNVEPEVGPAAPGTAPPDLHAHAPAETAGTEAGVVEPAATQTDAATSAATEPPANQLHPEAQIYFAMNGTEPEVVAHNPHDPPPTTDEPAAAAPAPLTHSESGAAHDPAHAPPHAAAKPEEPGQLASVEVVFPHDHG